jgi:hypothetical protein
MTATITPALDREQIIAEGGIPAEIFNYVNNAIEDPTMFPAVLSLSHWSCGWETVREIWTREKRPLVFLMDSKTEQIRVVNTNVKNPWIKPVFRGSLSPEGAKGAIAALRKLTAVTLVEG